MKKKKITYKKIVDKPVFKAKKRGAKVMYKFITNTSKTRLKHLPKSNRQTPSI